MSSIPTQTPKQPTQEHQRPMQGQQRPMQGQQRPMQGQQRPMQGQQRPMQGQQRPMQGQQRPMQGQQRPIQGQHSQRQAQRPPQRRKKSTISLTTTGKVVFIATAVILVLAMIIGTVALSALAISNFSDDLFGWVGDIFDGNDNGGSGNSGGSSNGGSSSSKPSTRPSTDKTYIVDANITLPSKTPSGTYLSSGSGDAISGISSNAAALIDVSKNTLIAGKNADTKIYPASMTKVMTLLVACEKATEAGELLTVEQWMQDYKKNNQASGSNYTAGEQITVEDALYLIIYDSDTVPCLLLSKRIAGSEAAFAKLMNQKAAALGLTNTNFTNSVGLHNDNHYTTCREMAAIMNAAMKNPIAKAVLTETAERTVPIYENGEKQYTFKTTTDWYKERLENDAAVVPGDPSMRIICGKTGWEEIPRACFVTVATDSNGKQYICVTVGRVNKNQSIVYASESTADTRYIYKTYAK